jgi:lysozyme
MALIRKPISHLIISVSLLAAIGGYEAFSPTAYVPVKGDVPTIGYGTTVHPNGEKVKMNETITRATAQEYLVQDVDKFKTGMAKCIKAPLSQYEFEAYTSLTYNIGTAAFCSSSIPRKLAAGDYKAACLTILQYNKMKDTSKPMVRNSQGKMVWQYKIIKGLDNRRKDEYKTCLKGLGND